MSAYFERNFTETATRLDLDEAVWSVVLKAVCAAYDAGLNVASGAVMGLLLSVSHVVSVE